MRMTIHVFSSISSSETFLNMSSPSYKAFSSTEYVLWSKYFGYGPNLDHSWKWVWNWSEFSQKVLFFLCLLWTWSKFGPFLEMSPNLVWIFSKSLNFQILRSIFHDNPDDDAHIHSLLYKKFKIPKTISK